MYLITIYYEITMISYVPYVYIYIYIYILLFVITLYDAMLLCYMTASSQAPEGAEASNRELATYNTVLYVYVCIYIYIFIYLYVYTCIHIYIYIYIYIY